jgi:Flp pilus assembly protein TadD
MSRPRGGAPERKRKPMAVTNVDLARESALKLYQSGRLSEAVALSRQFLNSQSNDADPLQILAITLSRLGAGVESIAIFRRIVALNPGSAKARNNLARLLRLARETCTARLSIIDRRLRLLAYLIHCLVKIPYSVTR